ncbi:NUDIX hydrolase [Micromonospora sonneratiae]|uniref:NUDIX hydrolase n=1 Tax=Micromonospora sonneratiae TaxID=1184706 RepID=A0ABW3YQ50_9ACTN
MIDGVGSGLVTERIRRIGAYGLCRDGERVLLARASESVAFPGRWQLPGGGVDHGEHPTTSVVREFGEETGLDIEVTGLRDAVSDVIRLPYQETLLVHTDRLIYDVRIVGGVLRDELDGTTDRIAWVTLAEAAGLPLMPFTAELLGVPVTPLPEDALTGPPPPAAPPGRRQRFAAYGLATDPAGRVLLSLIAEGYPGAGRWHLPGGGTDHGEQPEVALLRELVEEAGQLGRVTGLLGVSHRYSPGELGPEGVPIDWHGVRVVYRVAVDVPTVPRVMEAEGGSTARAAWFTPEQARSLPLTEVTAVALGQLGSK